MTKRRVQGDNLFVKKRWTHYASNKHPGQILEMTVRLLLQFDADAREVVTGSCTDGPTHGSIWCVWLKTDRKTLYWNGPEGDW